MKLFHRRSLRLKNWNYASAAHYFVTIKTKGNAPIFGNIAHEEMDLSLAGMEAKTCIYQIPLHFPDAHVSAYAILPDHIHLIISINEQTDFFLPSFLLHDFQKMTPRSLASIIKGFKIGVTKWCRSANGGNMGPNYVVWQRNYYEHIIRNDTSFIYIKFYIETNVTRHYFKMINNKKQ